MNTLEEECVLTDQTWFCRVLLLLSLAMDPMFRQESRHWQILSPRLGQEEVQVFSISAQPSHVENGSTGCLRVLGRIKCKDELDGMAYAYNPSTGGT